MAEIIDVESEIEAEAKKKVLESADQKPGQTTEELSKATGLSWDMTALSSGRLCQERVVKCIPRSHTKQGIRAEYFPT